MLNEELYDDEGPDPSPLKHGEQLFLNDEARVQLDASEGYAYFGYKERSSFLSYASAYRDAADCLAQSINDDLSSDNLAVPIIFLYRHYVELMLKELVIWGNKHFGNPILSPKDYGHKINRLWQELKPLLQNIYLAPEKSEEIAAVEACLLELSKVDDSSLSFRYPVDENDNPILENKPHLQLIHYIDIYHFAKVMRSLDMFFSETWMKFIAE